MKDSKPERSKMKKETQQEKSAKERCYSQGEVQMMTRHRNK